MAEKAFDPQVYLNIVKAEVELVATTLRHKGAKLFGKARKPRVGRSIA